MLNVGLIGIGAIGRLHYDCWLKCPHAKVAAFVSRDPKKRAGDWSSGEFNLGKQDAAQIDLTQVRAYESADQLFADPRIDIVDICTATPLHAPLSIAALRTGKHVVCEKPMALNVADCLELEAAARNSGKQLMVAHCLRYWPHYVRAHEMIRSGEYGRPLYARFHRSGGAPAWSSGGWLMKADQSGGVLDLHIHDIDVALWWFGKPDHMEAQGLVRDRLPLIVDAAWRYDNGLRVNLFGAWDPNGGSFRHAFRLVFEKATLEYDLAAAPGQLNVWKDGVNNPAPFDEPAAHQAELNDFARCVAAGEKFERFTPAESRISVEVGLQEMALLSA